MQQYQDFGMQLRLRRVEAGLFQRTMATLLGVGQPHLSWWETGKYKPSVGYLRRVNQFLALDPLALNVYVRATGLQPPRRNAKNR